MHEDPWASVLKVFEPYLLPWSMIFTLLSGIVGFFFGLYVMTKKAYTDRISEDYKKLRELQNFRDSLIHMIVHDLNNPLSVMLSRAQILKSEMKDGSTEEQEKEVSAIIELNKEMAAMISELLDINRMEEGKLEPDKEQVDLPDIILSVIEKQNTVAARTDKEILFDKTEDGHFPEADPVMIKRVLTNLIDNAIQFTPRGTSVRVSAEFSREENTWTVSVRDKGPGIPPEYRKCIFDKFMQVACREETKRQGKGLGLTFCKLAVEAHGGRIWSGSPEEGGSEFCFTLPVQVRSKDSVKSG
jgi:K+-sensing histidine kinase KdpD